ncbi:MAG: cation diffusion facilitator family transporter [Thermoplasmata archaeon]|nr:cation diffusion facilitator family transporter [Thermoplasmata archaeon]MCI4354140.1 cation diffusion facilitator family transporter [Thermoplasmata archaeon]
MRTQLVIWATIALNAALFAANLFVAQISQSHAVLSQAVYSLTDLVGGVLLLWGQVASTKPPTHEHPFGHGKERFFWSFSASLVTFTVSGLLVLTDSLNQLVSPHPIDHVDAALAVVGLSVVVSMVGIWVTLRELRAAQKTVQYLIESSHQGLKSIFYQDLVSIAGSVAALVGIALVFRTGNPVYDGIGASVVGILLVITGLVLAAESRELLIGKAISPDEARAILTIVERNSRVRRVREFQSMMLGPDDILIALRVNLQDALTTDEVETTIDEISSAVKATYPTVRHFIIEPES